MKDGVLYRVSIRVPRSVLFYRYTLKYDGKNKCFTLPDGTIIKPNNKRILKIEEEQ